MRFTALHRIIWVLYVQHYFIKLKSSSGAKLRAATPLVMMATSGKTLTKLNPVNTTKLCRTRRGRVSGPMDPSSEAVKTDPTSLKILSLTEQR